MFNPITSHKFFFKGTVKTEIILQIKHQESLIGEFIIKTEEYIFGLFMKNIDL